MTAKSYYDPHSATGAKLMPRTKNPRQFICGGCGIMKETEEPQLTLRAGKSSVNPITTIETMFQIL